MSSDLPPYASSESLSRSKTSQAAIRSLADEMLRASLTRGAAAPPSYHRSVLPTSTTSVNNPTKPSNSLRHGRNAGTASNTEGIVSAADAKARVRHLQEEVERAKAAAPHRSAKGLFKAACSTDLLFLMDTTGSMWEYIAAAKEQVKSIVASIKTAFLEEAEVRVAVVSYKDHNSNPNVEYLDFTTSTDKVFRFLGGLEASGGDDFPEDVLGGLYQGLNLSWKQQTRCIIHIADAPPHGAGVLHDLGSSRDDYARAGSEPHGLTYEPLIKRLIKLNTNYAFLRVNSSTDRMAFAFAQVYAASKADFKLLISNEYSDRTEQRRVSSKLWSGGDNKYTHLQFEEMDLGITYSQIQHLVMKSVTTSVTRTAGRLSLALSSFSSAGKSGGKVKKLNSDLFAIAESESSGRSFREVSIEESPPQWNTPGWLDETSVVDGFCPEMVMQSATSLNEMMNSDENIRLSYVQLTVQARSKPFAQGANRLAYYARTAASTSKFVAKFFKEDGKQLPSFAEDMRVQALCKAFALEFNGLLKIEPPIDFVVTMSLQNKDKTKSDNGCFSLEPYIDGPYVKYNSNGGFVKEDPVDEPDRFNEIAQAFSHFTFERSWGHFLVSDLQGVGHQLTDPAIQTRDKERFRLSDGNLTDEGFKFFFSTHKCNSYCRELELRSKAAMLVTNTLEFRESWPTMEPTVCCSSKLCRKIVPLASTNESDKFPGHHWCSNCWSQLQSSMDTWICSAPGPDHDFDTSRFFYASQGQLPPRFCSDHVEKDSTLSSAAALGGSLWNKMKSGSSVRSISGRSW